MAKEAIAPITCSHVCRGEGKIYSLIEGPSDLPGCEYRVSNRTEAGEPMPVQICRWIGHDGWVLMLPIAEATQICTVSALNDDGSVAQEAEFTFHAAMARMHSVANTVLRDYVVSQIRNYDHSPGGDRFQMYPLRIISAHDGDIIMHFFVEVMGESKEALEGDFETKLLRADGKALNPKSVIVLKDAISVDHTRTGVWVRTVTYSIRMSADAPSMIVWCVLHARERLEGFRLTDRIEMSGLRYTWDEITTNAAIDAEYDEWFRLEHMATEAELAIQAKHRFDEEPVFSIIVPLYHTPLDLFDATVQSVLRQSYGHFELVLVNSTPDDLPLTAAALAYAEADRRVVYVELPENRGITENTNAGIQVATGDFVCFLDHDDEITSDALFCYAEAVNDWSEVDLLYSDEDKMDGESYFAPYFKPGWSPDLLESVNYICHFLCVRKSIVDSLEPPTSEVDGSQDHHLAFRVTELTSNIKHIPRVLYHWRVVEGSTSAGIEGKSYAFENGLKVVQAHVDRCGEKAKVQANPRIPYGSGYEVVYELESEPLVSIIIPNKDNIDLLSRCIDSIVKRSTYANYEILVVENNSTEQETFDYYREVEARLDCVHVVHYEGGFNYSAVNNFGVGHANGDYLLLLNNDTEVVTENWIERMLGLCMRKSTGIVGVKLVYPDRTVQHGGVLGFHSGPAHLFQFSDADSYGYSYLLQTRQNLSCVTAACLMIKKAVFDEIGGFDERFVVDYNDVALCLATRDAGYLVVYEPAVELIHYESVSRGAHSSDASQVRFIRERGLLFEKWPEFCALPEQYSNPNFRCINNDQYQGMWRS